LEYTKEFLVSIGVKVKENDPLEEPSPRKNAISGQTRNY